MMHNKGNHRINYKTDLNRFKTAKLSFIAKMLSLKNFLFQRTSIFPWFANVLKLKCLNRIDLVKLMKKIKDQIRKLKLDSYDLTNQYVW